MVIGENNLSFIETSALDASNVELAFQNILTGKCDFASMSALYQGFFWLTKNLFAEIFRIVSSKALESGDSSANQLGDRKVVEITKTPDSEKKPGCC